MFKTSFCGFYFQILRYIYVSRCGLSENELLSIIPGLNWNFLGPFTSVMQDHLVLKYQSGLLMLAHEQVPTISEIFFMPPPFKEWWKGHIALALSVHSSICTSMV